MIRPLPLNDMPEKLLFWGGGDQARVLKPIVESLGSKVTAVIDDTKGLVSPFPDIDLFEGVDGFLAWASGRELGKYGFVIAIGNPYGHVRCKLHDYLENQGLRAVSFADHSANVDESAIIGSGVQIMRNVIVNVDAVVGRQCIVNTGAIVEHDDILEEGVEIGPGARLCGRVSVGRNTWICSGATVIPSVNIGANSIVAAGAVVIKGVESGVVVGGVPAAKIKDNVRSEGE